MMIENTLTITNCHNSNRSPAFTIQDKENRTFEIGSIEKKNVPVIADGYIGRVASFSGKAHTVASLRNKSVPCTNESEETN